MCQRRVTQPEALDNKSSTKCDWFENLERRHRRGSNATTSSYSIWITTNAWCSSIDFQYYKHSGVVDAVTRAKFWMMMSGLLLIDHLWCIMVVVHVDVNLIFKFMNHDCKIENIRPELCGEMNSNSTNSAMYWENERNENQYFTDRFIYCVYLTSFFIYSSKLIKQLNQSQHHYQWIVNVFRLKLWIRN